MTTSNESPRFKRGAQPSSEPEPRPPAKGGRAFQQAGPRCSSGSSMELESATLIGKENLDAERESAFTNQDYAKFLKEVRGRPDDFGTLAYIRRNLPPSQSLRGLPDWSHVDRLQCPHSYVLPSPLSGVPGEAHRPSTGIWALFEFVCVTKTNRSCPRTTG